MSLNRISRVISTFLISIVALPLPAFARVETLSDRLAGRLLIQAEQNGEAWYVDPDTRTRYYLSPENAFDALRNRSVEMDGAELDGYLANGFPARLFGTIVMDNANQNIIYYINPLTLRANRINDSQDVMSLVRALGLGISNGDIGQIGEADDSELPPNETDQGQGGGTLTPQGGTSTEGGTPTTTTPTTTTTTPTTTSTTTTNGATSTQSGATSTQGGVTTTQSGGSYQRNSGPTVQI